jgi:hypothetical protein
MVAGWLPIRGCFQLPTVSNTRAARMKAPGIHGKYCDPNHQLLVEEMRVHLRPAIGAVDRFSELRKERKRGAAEERPRWWTGGHRGGGGWMRRRRTPDKPALDS